MVVSWSGARGGHREKGICPVINAFLSVVNELRPTLIGAQN
jgi:hypothetical protein